MKPRRPMKTQRQMTREAMGRAGLHQTKARRRAYQEALAKRLGYKPAKLSNMPGVGKPSRYTVRKRITKYSVGTERQIKDVWEKEHFEKSSWGGAPRLVPGRMVQKWVDVVVKKTPIGERLIVTYKKKRGQGKGGGRGERESHKTGSAAAKKSVAKLAARAGGKRGARPRKEKKKKKK